MVVMPAVVFTLFHAVETEPLPFGSIFFVALLVTFVVLRRAACASRPASRSDNSPWPTSSVSRSAAPPRHTTLPGACLLGLLDLRGFLELVAFRATAPVARFLPSTLVPFIGLRPSALRGRQVRIESLLASLDEFDPIPLRSPDPL